MIKFIYYDVGGVAISDFSGNNKWEIMLNKLGVKPEQRKDFNRLYDIYKRRINLNMPVDGLKEIFSKKLGISFPKNFSWLDYFVENFEQNKPIWPVVKKSRKECEVGLLTNMYVGMFEKIMSAKLLPPTKWNVIIDSTKIGFQKPDKEIYEIAEVRSEVKGKEILFIDNDKENIIAAKDFGWQAFLYNPSNHENSCKELSEYISKLKVN